jgi:RNA methyltransferase, TrmH family
VIPVNKLEKLPRHQKLRKIAKIFTLAENRICSAARADASVKAVEPDPSKPSIIQNTFTSSELASYADVSKLLAADAFFPDNAKKVFEEASSVFTSTSVFTSASALAAQESPAQLRRALNSVKHLLLAAIGRDQSDWDFTASDGLLDAARRQVFPGMRVYMEDIRSPFNVGAMFRTAEIFGVEKIFLSQFCADPRHRRAERTAMGCVDIIPWERRDFFAGEENTALPFPIFALETGGIHIDKFPFPRGGLLIAGSEELGVSPRALASADASLGRVSIPVYGAKASLNVSVAFGITLQAWAKALS